MEPVALKGNVYVSTYGQTEVHSYLSPPDGLMVNTQIIEGRSSVVIFDGQLHLPYAEEVASYIKMIGKPVDRFILSHGHSDHWSGLQVLTERFPAAEVYAIAGVAELIRLRGSKTLERAKRLYGDRAATRVTVPSRILEEGVQEIDRVVYDFKKFEDGESEAQLRRFSPKLLIGLGALMSGARWIASSYTQTIWGLYATYGFLCGVGTGIVYIGIIGLMVKWFRTAEVLRLASSRPAMASCTARANEAMR